jgi:glycosyltransferase involved in cell wall biosynthesis
MTKEIVAFGRDAAVSLGPTLFLTPDTGEARRAGASDAWAEIRSVSPDEVPVWLRQARASFFFIRPTFAKRTSFPVKLAESLACGLPVVSNRGIGDLDGLIEAEGVGVFVNGYTDQDFAAARRALVQLLADPGTPARCRKMAESRYGLESGVAAYHAFYRNLCGEAAAP